MKNHSCEGMEHESRSATADDAATTAIHHSFRPAVPSNQGHTLRSADTRYPWDTSILLSITSLPSQAASGLGQRTVSTTLFLPAGFAIAAKRTSPTTNLPARSRCGERNTDDEGVL